MGDFYFLLFCLCVVSKFSVISVYHNCTKKKRYILKERGKNISINLKETYLPDLCEAPSLHGGNGYHQESGKVMI